MSANPSPSNSLNPLHKVENTDLQSLGKVLWSWQLCGKCIGEPTCSDQECPWARAKKLGNFWDHYKELTRGYVPQWSRDRPPALRGHLDLLHIIQEIKKKPDVARSEVTKDYFDGRKNDKGYAPVRFDQRKALSLAASILSMINCSTSEPSSFTWRDKIPFSNFLEEALPDFNHQDLYDDNGRLKKPNIRTDLTATALKRRVGLRFEPTNDLRSHLRLDYRNGTVQIFHQTAVLRENLEASGQAGVTDAATVAEFVASGNIPRRLALEVSDTIHKVLFPSDQESQELLQSLVSKNSFDDDFRYGHYSQYRSREDNDDNDNGWNSFHYFGNRLAELYSELQSPTPRGSVQRWFERKSGGRYVMMATLIGVIVAIVIGILGLGIASFQAWIAWQQWKHPIGNR